MAVEQGTPAGPAAASRLRRWMPVDGDSPQWTTRLHRQRRMPFGVGKYQAIEAQLWSERAPPKLWLELLGKSYVGLIYWTALVEFLRNLFWFQLKAGGLAPQVGFLAYLFIPPAAVGRPSFREFLDDHPWSRALLVVGGVLGLWGELDRSAIRRVTLSACGVGLLGIYMWEGMWAATTARRERTAFGMVGGILLLQVFRCAYGGPNPLVARWWGLLFLCVIPGLCAALLVLCEDMAESEGEPLQSFIEEDDDIELEQIETASSDERESRMSRKVEVITAADKLANGQDFQERNVRDISDRSTSCTVRNSVIGGVSKSETAKGVEINEEGGPHLLVLREPEGMPHSEENGKEKIEPNGIPYSEENGKEKIEQGIIALEDGQGFVELEDEQGIGALEDRKAGEIVETGFPVGLPTVETLHGWSWGFGSDAFIEVGRAFGGKEEEAVVIHPKLIESFDGGQGSGSPMKRTRRAQLMEEESLRRAHHTGSPKSTTSPRSVSSPMKNKRWGEGEEVPWLMDVRDEDISESELYVFRHKESKWNMGSCMRTAQMGIGSGSLLFLTHWILSAPTSISRWQGLSPQLGWVSILSFAMGVVTATEYSRILFLRRTQGIVFWALAALGASVLLWSSSRATLGGALLAFSAPSLWISVAQCNLENYPGGGLGIMVLIYILFVLWSTSLVAYQSIPALGFLRGTRSVLMGFVIAGIGVGVGREPSTVLKERAAYGGKWRGLFTSEIDARGRQAVAALMVLVGFIAAISLAALPHNHSRVNGVPDTLKVLNFNVQQGFNRAGSANYDSILSVLRTERPHVAMLQETDLMHIAHGNLDMINYWSTWLKVYSLYTPPTKSDTWGCALLSVYPFTHSEAGVLTSPKGENACYQYAQIEVDGRAVHLINTHFGTLENEITLQAQQLANTISRILGQPGEQNASLVLGGDLNSAPLSSSYNQTLSAGLRDAYVSQNGGWKSPGERDPGAGYIFSSPALNCTSWNEPRYDQQKTADQYPTVATFRFS